ncbi:hypothetical protein LT85_2061 [Collimonas arenae]|uniref:Uncharacterized protein n=1 Tax=Collimonas arenae TaxID=279058 RepID=A0A0A1FC30_9BURK|nr:hypothetical protein LT85_2061 [Collimonas arenae]
MTAGCARLLIPSSLASPGVNHTEGAYPDLVPILLKISNEMLLFLHSVLIKIKVK